MRARSRLGGLSSLAPERGDVRLSPSGDGRRGSAPATAFGGSLRKSSTTTDPDGAGHRPDAAGRCLIIVQSRRQPPAVASPRAAGRPPRSAGVESRAHHRRLLPLRRRPRLGCTVRQGAAGITPRPPVGTLWDAGTGPPRVPADGDLARGGGWLAPRTARARPQREPLSARVSIFTTARRPSHVSAAREDMDLARPPLAVRREGVSKRRPYDTDARIRPIPSPLRNQTCSPEGRVECPVRFPRVGIPRSASVGRRAGPRALPHDDRCFAATPPTPVSAPDGDEQHRGGRASTLARAIPDSAG